MPELLQDWVTLQAERRPEAPAVVLGATRLAYGELETRSDRIAQALRAGGCRRGDRVGLLSPKSPDAVAAIIGIYKADCVYVPLDPAGPARRVARILRGCGPRWLIAAAPAGRLLDDLALESGVGDLPRVIWLGAPDRAGGGSPQDLLPSDLDAMPAKAPPRRNRSDDLAHILHTSGSTGAPKGVMITHRNVIAFVEWAVERFGIAPGERLSAHPPLHFDLSVFDIFGAFAAGASSHQVPAERALLPLELVRWMRESRIVQWFSVPSALNYVAKFDALPPDGLPELERVLWCGEVLPTPTLIHWMRRLPRARFTNLYGPTETTIASSHHTLERCPDDPAASIPIGEACGGEELLVLDEGRRPVPVGATGELYIGGVGLSPGYWDDPAETARRFVECSIGAAAPRRLYRSGDLARRNADGRIGFVGRVDMQVKSRGYRIELGEIETALQTIDALRECAVVARPSDGFDGMRICCAFVPQPGAAVSIAALRGALAERLPDYMVPTRWMAFGELPKNPAGKIDRRRLQEVWRDDAFPDAR